MMADEIVDCGGIYEAHPTPRGGWAVVNSRTGNVRGRSDLSRDKAVAEATELNEDLAILAEVCEHNWLCGYCDICGAIKPMK